MENRCISCGEVIPEGRQVCYSCEKNKQFILQNDKKQLKNIEREKRYDTKV
mgnify:CR=1 FL=1